MNNPEEITIILKGKEAEAYIYFSQRIKIFATKFNTLAIMARIIRQQVKKIEKETNVSTR